MKLNKTASPATTRNIRKTGERKKTTHQNRCSLTTRTQARAECVVTTHHRKYLTLISILNNRAACFTILPIHHILYDNKLNL